MYCDRADIATACGQNVARDTVSWCLKGHSEREKSVDCLYVKAQTECQSVFENL